MKTAIPSTCRLPLASVLALLFAAGCQTTPWPFEHTTPLPAEGLVALQPADVAVAPIVDVSGSPETPVVALREAFQVGLVDRLFSPVAIEYFDANWVDASFVGDEAPDATLSVKIMDWDTSLLIGQRTVVVAAEIAMYAGTDFDGMPLWAVQLTRRVELARSGILRGSRDDHLNLAARLFAKEALGLIPERNPLLAPR